MKKETEIQKYMAEFSKKRDGEDATYDYVRVIKTSKFGYDIVKGHNYGTKLMPDDWSDEIITCNYPSTVGWIFERFRNIVNFCNCGDIITDIQFESE